MKKPDDLKRVPGVFALLHAQTAQAYVNETKDLKQRAMLWETHLRNFEEGTGIVPAKDFPRYPHAEWEFWTSGHSLSVTRDLLATQGWNVINDFKPRKTYRIVHPNGVTIDGSLAQHCKNAGLKVHTVYKRLNRGMSVEQALGLTALPPMDKRELAISQMRVQIESDSGGLLTYDEAVMMRPQVGDIREKIKRLRLKNPELSKVKLSEIPV